MIKSTGDTGSVHKKQRRASRRHDFFGRVRSVFGFLLVATALVFAFSYREDLQDFVVSNLYQWSQAELKNNGLRQSAVNYENEVNQAAQ